MGMTARCGACGHAEPSDNRRGGRLGKCLACGGQMQAHTAGQAKGRYLCPVTGEVVTLGLGSAVQLDALMRPPVAPSGSKAGQRALYAHQLRYVPPLLALEVLGP
jgi:hypothetical protein